MNIRRNKKSSKLGRSFILNSQFSILNSARGMTLVELLVAVSIMMVLVAVSVPMFKPMLESQKAAGGARTVALALQRARVKAMETGIPHGIEFQRFTTGATPSTTTPALQMYLVSAGKPVTGTIGNITPGGILSGGDVSDWGTTIDVQVNDKIQLKSQGKYYTLGSGWQLQWNGASVTFSSGLTDVPYKIIRQPRTTTKKLSLVPPMTMPRGTVVDLRWSGFDVGTMGGDCSFCGPVGTGGGGPVVVMFAPNGTIDRVYYHLNKEHIDHLYDDPPPIPPASILTNDVDDDRLIVQSTNGPEPDLQGSARLIYFCVGEWERQVDASDTTLAEDGKGNLRTMSNYWVTVNARTGEMRTAEMGGCEMEYRAWQIAIAGGVPAVILQKHLEMIAAARKFATEHFVNIGEQ